MEKFPPFQMSISSKQYTLDSVSLHFLQNYLFIYWLPWVFIAASGLSLAAVSGGGAYSLFAGHGLLTVADSLVVEHELSARGLQELWHMGCVALWHVEVSLTRDWTHISCIGRQTLNHWTTKEVQHISFSFYKAVYSSGFLQAWTLTPTTPQPPKYSQDPSFLEGFRGSDGEESACNVGELSSTPALGRSPGEGNDNPLQYSCLENSMDRGVW